MRKSKVKHCMTWLMVVVQFAVLPAVYAGGNDPNSNSHNSKHSVAISGKVTGPDGNPVVGATVTVKGTNRAVATGADGSFTIDAKSGETLVISAVGFATQEIAVGSNTTVAVQLAAGGTQLSEVVVTALGIKREKRALGYSAQNVTGESLTKAREVNILNSLQGKLAGVEINKAGTGPAGSSRITIRGNNFLPTPNGTNQPLIVVDGIPMDNYQTATGQSEYGSFDGGNGLSQINPDDIEDINVLKGPAASALYGIRGGNGVLVITTKKGVKRKGLGVKFNTGVTVENPLIYPELQNEYGQGSDGLFDVKAGGSWGPKITGQQITDWTGQSRPMTADPNDLKNFLQQGVTTNNAIELSGGGEKTVFRISYSNLYNKGLLPNSTLRRDFASVNISSQVTNAFLVEGRVNYTNERTKNRPQTSGSPSNVFANYYAMPRSIHLTDMNPYQDAEGAMVLWLPTAYSTLRNPYWTQYMDFNNDQTDRFLTMIRLEYKFTNWLKLQVRNGMDMRQAFNESANAYGIRDLGSGALNFGSGYQAYKTRSLESNTDFLLAANRKVADDWSLGLSFGGNSQYSKFNNVGGTTGLLDLPGVYSLNVGTLPRPSSDFSESKINSLYGFLNVGFRNYLFFDATYRNDWVSVLSSGNRSFHYPSYSLSAIVNDMWRDIFKSEFPEAISYLKIRGAYAEAGSVTIAPYSLDPTFSISRGYGDANLLVTSTPSTLFDPNIKPGLVKSSEIGAEIKFFNNRLGADFTYYTKDATNQILQAPLPIGTGFNGGKFINAGKIRNQGYEFTVTATPIKKNLVWDIVINYNHNKNEVIELSADQKTFYLQGDVNSRAIRIMANEGQPYGNIYGRDFARDASGNIIVETDGTPRKSDDKNVLLGNFQPKYLAGIQNNFSYKGLYFSFLIDIRHGGQFYSQSLAYEYAAGTAKGTLPYREGGMVVDGVLDNGSKNTTAINSQQYWAKVAGAEPVASQFIYDASNVRLREAVIGYTIPNHVWGNIPIRNVYVSLVGRNLWMISKHIPGLDPESSFSTTDAQGWENGAYPSTRSFGASLRVEF
ncbi:MAG: SusC/RagA family TonB-linked outer membrane protein [Bacteroidetes bacterium]|nr:MAG: SusC/RagA family TonB-linked outer membrane protein [Bacteroidota bacterium]